MAREADGIVSKHDRQIWFSSSDNKLPGGGWPASALIELLLLQHGIGGSFACFDQCSRRSDEKGR
jgi:hypothetical protein